MRRLVEQHHLAFGAGAQCPQRAQYYPRCRTCQPPAQDGGDVSEMVAQMWDLTLGKRGKFMGFIACLY